MTDKEIPDINKIKEIMNNIKWVTVTRRIGGDKLEWFLWRLRKEKISHRTLGQGVNGQIIQVDGDMVLLALKILDEPVVGADDSVEAGVVWDDLPNDHPIFKNQADDIPSPGMKLTGQWFDYETGKPLGGFFSEKK